MPCDEPISLPRPLPLPVRVTTGTRAAVRRLALAHAERSKGAVVLDLADTVELDASGLGILALVHRRARERGLVVRLLNVRREVRELLKATRMEDMFEFEEDSGTR